MSGSKVPGIRVTGSAVGLLSVCLTVRRTGLIVVTATRLCFTVYVEPVNILELKATKCRKREPFPLTFIVATLYYL